MLAASPIDLVAWKTPRDAEAIDRSVVVNPQRARELFADVRSDPALETFLWMPQPRGFSPRQGEAPGGGWLHTAEGWLG
jgi:hypothetical protein